MFLFCKGPSFLLFRTVSLYCIDPFSYPVPVQPPISLLRLVLDPLFVKRRALDHLAIACGSFLVYERERNMVSGPMRQQGIRH
jgi:hypothetical protein